MRKAPFPYFGGKSGAAQMIWDRIGQVRMYVEPFAGSLAVLLGKQPPASLEVVGDLNYFIANFWRALRAQPDAVADWADYPGSHIDLHARHAWLMDEARRKALETALCDAEWPGDAQIAGWWCYGLAHWIGSGWCAEGKRILHASDAGQGVGKQLLHASNAGRGVGKQLLHASDAGRGWGSRTSCVPGCMRSQSGFVRCASSTDHGSGP